MSRSFKIDPNTMHCITLKLLVFSALAAGTAHHAQAENPYWDQYGSETVSIKQGGSQTLQFVSYKDGMLNAQLQDGMGEVSLPVNESMVSSFELKLDITSAKQIIAGGNYEVGLQLLRPQVYPLIKFYQLPENFIRLHQPLQGLLNTLIEAEQYDEIKDLIGRMQLNQCPMAYSQIAIRLIQAYIDQSDYQNAVKITQMLPLDGDYKSNISKIVDIADQLRAAGIYEAVIPIYREIKDLVPDAVRTNVEMWLAYSLVLDEQLEEALPLIEKLQEPAMEDRLFSLYQLLHGTLAHRQQDYPTALDQLTRGFVRAQPSYPWVSEMLYLIGECYNLQNDPEAARSVWTELTILYPDSSFSTRAKTSLEQLPQPQTAEN
ncbi:MAG: tetratricopeptide (TPR) repeat protein [Lentimonas sp.]|jgi:tetratricopeptide (TPR) repeat protein